MTQRTTSQPPNPTQGSLWTTPVVVADFGGALAVNQTVTSQDLDRAVESVRERAAVFSGGVSDEALTLVLD